MDFQVDEWKELEANLKKRLQTEEDNRLQLEQWLQQGRASQTPGSTKVATLEFDSRDGWVATILPVQTVPDEITAAITVIHTNYPNSIIFRSEQELDAGAERLPWKQWENTHTKVDGFRHKRNRQFVFRQTQ